MPRLGAIRTGSFVSMKRDFIEEYLNWKATYSVSAARNYRIWLLRFKEWVKDDLENATLEKYVSFKMNLDARYASTTVQLAIIGIKDFYRFLYDRGVRCLKYVLIKIPKAQARSMVPITEKEYRQMLRWCCVSEYRELQKTLLVRLLWDTGMRVSELCSLNISSLYLPKKCGVVVTKKNNQQRMIFWSDETHELLIKYLGVRIAKNQQPALFQGLPFYGDPTRRISVKTIQRIVGEFVKKCEFKGKKITCHSFRHGKAHHIIELGGTVLDVQTILGHRNPNSSFAYLRMSNTELEARARRFL